MDWKTAVIIAAVVVAFIVWKRVTLIPVATASDHLRQGALLIDVRTSDEFAGRHLPGAVNIPVSRIEEIEQRAKDKEQVLLLHCLSGTRSGFAVRKLKSLGYTRVYNLGSYSRAEKVVESSSASGS
jgi:phage shock protein E